MCVYIYTPGFMGFRGTAPVGFTEAVFSVPLRATRISSVCVCAFVFRYAFASVRRRPCYGSHLGVVVVFTEYDSYFWECFQRRG